MRRIRRSAHLVAPTAVLSTLALSLTAAPAHAAQAGGAQTHTQRTDPASAARRDAAARAATEAAPATYTIRAGDTISAVAERFGLHTADVLAGNGLDWSTTIYPGQVITLSPSPSAPAAEAAPEPASDAVVHTVASGDTLWAIAQAGGVSLDALLAANGLSRASIIYPGQQIAVPTAQPAAAASAPADAASATALDAEQQANAQIIIQVGRERGVPDRGIAIALAAAMVESWIRNVDHGDRDSLGLFQQRPSAGWGTADQVRDPYWAAAAFFGGPSDPNGTATRGLLDVDGWESMDFGAAAQAVQVSAYPERYGPWEQQAYQWLAALG
ncbi:LysM peptidoglycan-binding domain-containing protein [Microbacterium sp.]|uniref:lytic transglycosylase n=1 Tax=Microbacterium sp. TaxID=51671 RepID=UPI0039E691AB